MPDGATVEDTLKIMESIAKLGHKTRADKREAEIKMKFGFNKNDESEADKDQSQK